jgi:ABC-type maltose transport system permease subunit
MDLHLDDDPVAEPASWYFWRAYRGSRPKYDAAEVDGATWLRRLTSITVPLLTPYILYNLLIGLIAAFQHFAASRC